MLYILMCNYWQWICVDWWHMKLDMQFNCLFCDTNSVVQIIKLLFRYPAFSNNLILESLFREWKRVDCVSIRIITHAWMYDTVYGVENDSCSNENINTLIRDDYKIKWNRDFIFKFLELYVLVRNCPKCTITEREKY